LDALKIIGNVPFLNIKGINIPHLLAKLHVRVKSITAYNIKVNVFAVKINLTKNMATRNVQQNAIKIKV
jgi:hypothetical protein